MAIPWAALPAAVSIGQSLGAMFGGDDGAASDHDARERAFHAQHGFAPPRGNLRRALMAAEPARIRDARRYRKWARSQGTSLKRAAARGWPVAVCHKRLQDPRTRAAMAERAGRPIRCGTREGARPGPSGPAIAPDRVAISSQQRLMALVAILRAYQQRKNPSSAPPGVYT